MTDYPVSDRPYGSREATFENVVLGEPFGPLDVVVDPYKIRRFAFVMDDWHPWSFGPSPFGGAIGQAGLLTNDLLQLFTLVYDPNTVVGLHTEEQLWFHSPVFVGETARLDGRYVEQYERRGKGHVVMEAEARGPDGRLLVRHRGVEIMRIEAGKVVGRGTAKPLARRVTGEYRKDLAQAETARPGLPRGTPIAPITKLVRQEQMSVFSGADAHLRNIHTDIDVARRAGLTNTLVQGMMEGIYLTELMARFFGASWYTTGWEQMKFLKPVYARETLTARGVVTGETGDGRLEVEMWTLDSKGQMTAAGWASAVVRGQPAGRCGPRCETP